LGKLASLFAHWLPWLFVFLDGLSGWLGFGFGAESGTTMEEEPPDPEPPPHPEHLAELLNCGQDFGGPRVSLDIGIVSGGLYHRLCSQAADILVAVHMLICEAKGRLALCASN